MNERRSLLIPWLRLLRFPNLFTVPGDPLAGFFLAGAAAPPGNALLAVGAALCFYVCGLVLNDLVDVEEDARERPGRPLPAGTITTRQAKTVVSSAATVGLVLCYAAPFDTLVLGLALLGLVFIYNLRGKRSALFGPVVMALCRAGSVLLGASAAGGDWWKQSQVWVGAAAIGFYIWIVSVVARDETSDKPPSPLRWLLPVTCLGWAGLAFVVLGLPSAVLFTIAAAYTLAVTLSMPRTGVPPAIGHLIRGLCLVQAALILLHKDGVPVACAVLLLVLPACLLGRRIPAS